MSRVDRRGLTAAIAATTIAIALVAPGLAAAQDVVEPEPASVRFLSGSFHGPADVYADGVLVAEGLEFATATEYLDLPGGDVRFETVGQGMMLEEVRDSYGTGLFPNAAEATQALKPGTAYTVIVNGSDSGHTEFRFTQDKATPKAGKVQARVIDMCTYCGPLDFYAGKAKKPFAKGLDYKPAKQASKYAKVKAGELDVVPRVQGFKKPAGDFEPVTLEPGTANSLYMVGRWDAGTMTLVPLLDAAVSNQRVLNASAAGPKLDVYVDGKRVARKVAPGKTLKVKNVLADEHEVQLVTAGADPAEAALVQGSVVLEPGPSLMSLGVGADATAALSGSELAPGGYEVLMGSVPDDGSLALLVVGRPLENVVPEPVAEEADA